MDIEIPEKETSRFSWAVIHEELKRRLTYRSVLIDGVSIEIKSQTAMFIFDIGDSHWQWPIVSLSTQQRPLYIDILQSRHATNSDIDLTYSYEVKRSISNPAVSQFGSESRVWDFGESLVRPEWRPRSRWTCNRYQLRTTWPRSTLLSAASVEWAVDLTYPAWNIQRKFERLVYWATGNRLGIEISMEV